jgi:hypothetical protein
LPAGAGTNARVIFACDEAIAGKCHDIAS